MHDPTTPNRLGRLVIYESDEVLYDSADPSTYIVCETAQEIAAALAAMALVAGDDVAPGRTREHHR
jgi:hypothetical protein